MVVHAIVFYVFAVVLIASALMVISARNPVHSVLWLILGFFNGAGLFLLMGAEFLAMVLVIVYVGAVAVLFLFVVMMLNVNVARLRQGFLDYLPIGAGVGLVLLGELLLAFGAGPFHAPSSAGAPDPGMGAATNTEAIGQVLYTDYVYLFQGAGIVLLIGMVGSILLTLRHRPGVRRQDVHDQTHRDPRTAVTLKKVPTGEGLG